MSATTIVVIPAEGDSAETEIWYVKALKQHYKIARRKRPKILVFEHDSSAEAVKLGVALSTQLSVYEFIRRHHLGKVEIHAQGGLGAYVACEFLRQYELQRDSEDRKKGMIPTNVFMIGGASSETMTWIAAYFHRWHIRLWYRIRKIIPFFADDPPNSKCDEEIAKIRASSTQVMRANPELYRDQILCIGNWRIAKDWKVPRDVNVWYVPNGKTLRSKMRDNSYDDEKAKASWLRHGALITGQPEDNFSFYTMMPAQALFQVMDDVR